MSKESNIELLKKNILGESVRYDEHGQQIWGQIGGENIQHVADIRGWGRIQNIAKDATHAAELQDELGSFISEAINFHLNQETIKKENAIKAKADLIREIDTNITLREQIKQIIDLADLRSIRKVNDDMKELMNKNKKLINPEEDGC